ncbi:MAG: helix-turn-helix transcriptional regulator, partial [Flavobacteriaceae bacterium]|nr:helix-turn-helix transcriptional regulator [Flavobacteriaceae bacterium]
LVRGHSVKRSNQNESLNPQYLKVLLNEMQESLNIEEFFDTYIPDRFSWYNKGKYNPFGFDVEEGSGINVKHQFFRLNRIRHKLIRIHKEFKFVNNHLENYQNLTLREKEIIQLLANGYNNPQIANELHISRCTVENHRKNINAKLNLPSFAHLIHFCYSFNLI